MEVSHFTIADAKRELAEMMDPDLFQVIKTMEEFSRGRWVADPEVQGTFGFIKQGTIKTAVVIVYSPDRGPWMTGPDWWDFECDDVFLQDEALAQNAYRLQS